MKIWQTIMTMRDESKQVQDAVYEAITKGWVQNAVNPLLDITYLVSFYSSLFIFLLIYYLFLIKFIILKFRIN